MSSDIIAQITELFANWDNLPPALQQSILDGPALLPPVGVDPNFKNPSIGNTSGIILVVICLFFAITATIGRAYSRLVIQKKLYVEDCELLLSRFCLPFLMVIVVSNVLFFATDLAFVGFAAYVVLIWVYLEFLHKPGFFVHQWDLLYQDMPRIAKLLSFGLTISYSFAILFFKVAILLEWIRLFSPRGANTSFYRSSQAMIWITVLFYTASIISLVMSCTPRERIWKPWVKGRCINRKAMGVVTAIFNAVLDLLMVALPLRVIWSLRMDRRRKLRISLVFSVGLMATACAVGRAVVSFDIIYTIGDSTYTMTPQLLWAVPEVTCVLLVLCLPALPRIFADQSPLKGLFRSLSSWTWVSAAGGGSGGSGHRYGESQRAGIGTPPPLSLVGKWPPTISSIVGSRHYRMEENEDGQAMSLVNVSQMRLEHGVPGDVQHGHREHDDISLPDRQLSDIPLRPEG